MKLAKALESGRPFRFKGEPNLYTTFEATVTGEGGKSRGVTADEVDGNNWEPEPKEVKVTRTALEAAMTTVVPPISAQTQAEIIGKLGL